MTVERPTKPNQTTRPRVGHKKENLLTPKCTEHPRMCLQLIYQFKQQGVREPLGIRSAVICPNESNPGALPPAPRGEGATVKINGWGNL
ncbi:hypothetical protein CDAR_74171 [Caerostris darwini]|uniref:Peptidase S1 domain-containing protein n=1 Tax=Caerostris darwini TaxID=1538125 RepID=A0AAV4Q9F8_9ARAC|nr:hypothetical protein CDAR_74171 [Caerostris darwini]